MTHPLISADQFPQILPKPPDASAAWNAFTVHIIEPPPLVTMACTDHVVGVLFSGRCRFRQNAYGRSTEQWTGPGAVHVLPARFEGTWEGRQRTGRFRGLALFIPDAYLSRVVASEWGADPGRVEILQRFNTRDPVIEALLNLAELAGVTPRHFERAFRQGMGIPPHAYILQRRVLAACDLLISYPTLPIHQIAVRVGFSSASHLAAIFRRHTGKSPSAFRREAQ